jgi:hypothetical protein
MVIRIDHRTRTDAPAKIIFFSNRYLVLPMKKRVYLIVLTIVSVSSLATGCSTAQGTTKEGRSGGFVQIEPRTYNSETRGFDRPWPFGPESSVQ